MYVGLYIAIRSGNWDLRMACVKKMMPLCNIAGRQNYSKILPYHLAVIDSMSATLLDGLRKG